MTHRGMGSVFQPRYTVTLPDGSKETRTAASWWIKFYLHGRPIKENAHTTSRSKAVARLKQRTGQAAIGVPVGPEVERTTLSEILAMVENDYIANGRRSLKRVSHACAHLKEFFDSAAKVRDISPDRITAYQARRLAEKAKPATVNYELAMLRRGFRLGLRAGKIARHPEVQMLHVENARTGFFEPAQHRAVMRHLPDYLQPLAAVAYITGWRTKSELLTRQWRHVDFANGWMRLEPGESKNGDGREFPFTRELRSTLEAQREHVREIERATGRIIPWVFVHPLNCGRAAGGSRIKDFRGAWKQACKAAGVPDRRVHDFRRTAVRNLERAGVPRSAAMKMTGHRTEAVYRRYAITDAAMLQEAALKLDVLHAAETDGTRTGQEQESR